MRECLQDLGRDGRERLVPVLGGTYLTLLQGSGDQKMEGTGQRGRKVSAKIGGREASQVVRLLGPLSLPELNIAQSIVSTVIVFRSFPSPEAA